MRESITEALRGVVAGGGDRGDAQDDGANAADPNFPVLVNGIEIQGLADLVGALKRGEEKKANGDSGHGNGKQDHPGLAAYRKKLEEQMKQAGRVPERLGSEEHEELKKGFGRRYDEDEGGEEKKERKRDEL